MHRNTEMLNEAAERLGPLVNEVVFVGGATTGLFITDPLVTDVRPTLDVDVIVEVTTRPDYYHSTCHTTLLSGDQARGVRRPGRRRLHGKP